MATEKRLIDANAEIEAIKKYACKECNNYGGIKCRSCWADDVIGFLEDAPAVEAVEINHGQWINNKDDYPECDNCGYRPMYDHMIDDIFYSPYCPNCGSKMMNGVRYETD